MPKYFDPDSFERNLALGIDLARERKSQQLRKTQLEREQQSSDFDEAAAGADPERFRKDPAYRQDFEAEMAGRSRAKAEAGLKLDAARAKYYEQGGSRSHSQRDWTSEELKSMIVSLENKSAKSSLSEDEQSDLNDYRAEYRKRSGMGAPKTTPTPVKGPGLLSRAGAAIKSGAGRLFKSAQLGGAEGALARPARPDRSAFIKQALANGYTEQQAGQFYDQRYGR